MGALRTASLAGDMFAPPVLQLVEDAQGGARYWPSVVDPDTARRWFDALVEGADWRSLRRPMYDRVVDVPRLLAALEEDFELTRVSDGTPLSMAAEAAQDHTVAIGVCTGQGERWVLRLKDLSRAYRGMPPEVEGGMAELDVNVLQNLILEPYLGIDTETLARTEQVAYTIDEGEACSRVVSGEAQAAFILNATRIEQVWSAAERGLIMPQKSTYFHPKLLTGLVINPLDER